MPTDTERSALATFDAFLDYMRGGSVPRSIGAGAFSDERTDPSLSAEKLSLEAPMPRRGAPGRPRRDDPFGDDEATMVGLVPRGEGPKPLASVERAAKAPRRAAPIPMEPEQSIIVDDQALEPEPPSPGSALPAGELFVIEMNALVKYGHGAQVPAEINRFLRSNDALDVHVTVAEFEFATVDTEQGLERLFRLAPRALEAGDHALARRLLEKAARAAPHDLRVAALRERIRGR